jgi:hypothetical protein
MVEFSWVTHPPVDYTTTLGAILHFLELNNQSTCPILLLTMITRTILVLSPLYRMLLRVFHCFMISTNEREKNADSQEIELMMDPAIQKMMADEYEEKWGEEHCLSNSGTSNEGDKETHDKEQVHNESDGADDTDSDTENEDEAYVPDDDEPVDENTNVPGSDEVPDDDVDGAYYFFSEEEQASDEVDEPHPEEKKKSGRKYNKLNRFDKLFLERLADLAKYYAANGDTKFRREYTTAEGRQLGNWVHDQRKNIIVGNC